MTALGLTDEQKTQFVALQQSHQEKMATLRESGQRPDRETMEAARTEYDAALAKILTAEQLAKYQQMRPEPGQRGRRGPGGGAGPGKGFGPPPAGDGGQPPPPPPDGGGE